jgi:hypothetical protein
MEGDFIIPSMEVGGGKKSGCGEQDCIRITIKATRSKTFFLEVPFTTSAKIRLVINNNRGQYELHRR